MSLNRVLISPLSWGQGHAGRMIPLALRLKSRGCEVSFAADAPLLEMVGREMADVTLIEIPGLRIGYSRHLPQYLAVLLQLPRIIISAVRDHRLLKRLAEEVTPDFIISDNRFGFWHREICSVYVTHQLRIPLPKPFRFLEPLAAALHRMIINRYDLCLVPDYPGSMNLSGRLSHDVRLPRNVCYTGPLSRFSMKSALPSPAGMAVNRAAFPHPYTCLILSGPEPQRSLLLEKVCSAMSSTEGGELTDTTAGNYVAERDVPEVTEPVTAGGAAEGTTAGDQVAGGAVPEVTDSVTAGGAAEGATAGEQVAGGAVPEVTDSVTAGGAVPENMVAKEARDTAADQGSVALPGGSLVVLSTTPVTPPEPCNSNIHSVVAPDRETMKQVIEGASLIIARSGYSTIMELASMRRGALLIATPGQPEQEYLGSYLHGRYGFINLRQKGMEGQFLSAAVKAGSEMSDPAPLLEHAITRLLKHKKE